MRSYQAVATNGERWNEKYFNNDQEKNSYLNNLKKYKINVYESVNRFSSPKRSETTVKELTALFCDLDCHDGVFDEKQTLEVLRKEYLAKKVPYPSEITNSGRGLHLYWYLDNESAENLATWKTLQHIILNSLEPIKEKTTCNVDFRCMNVSRVLRTKGTYNTNSNTICHIIENKGIKYTLKGILEDFYGLNKGEIKVFNPKATNNTQDAKKTLTDAKNVVYERVIRDGIQVKGLDGAIHLFNAHHLLVSRANDLKELIKLRGRNMTGVRDNFLMIYAWTVISKKDDLETVERELLGINEFFTEPLTEKEVRYKAKNIFDKYKKQVIKDADPEQLDYLDRYWFRNTTIIKNLEITQEEQKHMKTIISKEEKNKRKCEREKKARRNENGLTKKQQEKQDRYNTIQEMKRLGYTQSDVANALNVSVKTVKRQWK